MALLSLTDRRILSIALPSIVSNITVPLLGLADVSVTGHMSQAAADDTAAALSPSSYVGGIAVGGMMFNIIYWVFSFLRMETGGETARAFGRRDTAALVLSLARGMSLAVVLAMALMLFSPLVRDAALWYIAPDVVVATLARTYYNICIFGAVPVLGLYVLNGWYIGMQNSRIPMYVAILQNLLNILCSLFFVFVLGMRIEGIALGTLLALWVAFLTAMLLCVRNYGHILRKGRPGLPSFVALLRLAITPDTEANRHNVSLFLRTLCLVVVHFMFVAAGASQGSVELAVNTLLMQLFTFFSFFMDGFAYAGEALAGKAFGTADRVGCSTVVRRLFLWGGVVSLLFVVLYACAGEDFVALLTDDASVLVAVSSYYHWTLLLPLCGVASFLWDGIYTGVAATRLMLLSMALSMLVFLAGYYSLIPVWGNHGLWVSFLAYLACRGLIQTFFRSRIFI
ncbi:MAG: MATE family efflux transporter [Bacteroidaceae bacterium]|nr:MATE family efflux transporter [Bacteroidaceae bacterium]